MTTIHGYPVVTSDGKTVGRVAGETETALVVEYGSILRRIWRALPRRYAVVDANRRVVVMQASKEMLAMSPKLSRGVPVDDSAVESWWGRD